LNVGGDLSISSAGITASPAAQTAISATGALTVASPAAGSSGTLPLLLGGQLALSGDSVNISGTVSAPAGIITLTSNGDLNIDGGATISTAGSVVSVGNQSAGTPGGSIALTAGGNLTLSPNVT
jgi:hypothetical protein